MMMLMDHQALDNIILLALSCLALHAVALTLGIAALSDSLGCDLKLHMTLGELTAATAIQIRALFLAKAT